MSCPMLSIITKWDLTLEIFLEPISTTQNQESVTLLGDLAITFISPFHSPPDSALFFTNPTFHPNVNHCLSVPAGPFDNPLRAAALHLGLRRLSSSHLGGEQKNHENIFTPPPILETFPVHD